MRFNLIVIFLAFSLVACGDKDGFNASSSKFESNQCDYRYFIIGSFQEIKGERSYGTGKTLHGTLCLNKDNLKTGSGSFTADDTGDEHKFYATWMKHGQIFGVTNDKRYIIADVVDFSGKKVKEREAMSFLKEVEITQ